MDQTFLRIRDHHHTLQSVVEGVSEDRADIRHVQSVQKSAVRHAGDPYIELPCFSEFCRENGIKYSVACPLRQPPFVELILDLVQPGFSLLLVGLAAQALDLVLEIMLHHMEHFFAFLIVAELLILAAQDMAHSIQFLVRSSEILI